jgi:PAS domain S-box-containing protein
MKIFSQRNYINTLLLIALIVLTGGNILSYQQTQRLLDTNEWIIHTHNIIETVTELQLSLVEIESQFENVDFTQQSLNTNLNKINQYIGLLKASTLDNTIQQNNIAKIIAIQKARVAILQEIFSSQSKKDQQIKLFHSTSQARQILKQDFTTVINAIIQEEQYLLQVRNIAFSNNTEQNKFIFIVISVLSESLLLLSLILLNNYLTEREIAEAKKSESEEKLRLIINGTSDYAIIMLDPTGNVTTWSAGAEKITGYAESEIIGKNFSYFYTKEAIAHHSPEIELEIAKSEGRYEEENWRVRKDGTQYLANDVITAIRNQQGELIGFGKITRDMSERKKIEQMKNEFISVVSHELRTPITSIRGALGLILGGAVGTFTDKATKLLNIANHNCERLLLLINDILDIEKIETGKMNFQLKIVDLNQLVNEAISTNKIYGEKYAIDIQLTQTITYLKVNVDTDRLIQVLTNLISNAVKFASKNTSVDITITRNNEFARVSVTNMGRGISKEFQPHIFQKFSQADSSDTRNKDGSGLGLNISKAIIEKMGGTLQFVSTPNEQTTFYFELPICSEIPVNMYDVSSENVLIDHHKKLLICEDDEDQANYLKVLLESAGYESDIAPTVADAKKLLAESTYQAILLDLILPDEDGITFIRELRRDERTEQLPIIVQSVIAQTGRTLINGEAFAVVDWLDKPVDFGKLLHAITLVRLRMHENKPHILHVEDDLDTHNIIKALLEEKVDVTPVFTLEQARKKLAHEKFDLVILDLLLPDGNGAELLPLMSKYKLPVIVYSSVELDRQYSQYVSQELIKSKTSNEELISLIQSLTGKNF